MPEKTRVFISHISTESALAEGLKKRLQGDFLGLLDIFVSSDQTTIAAGKKWLDEVDEALKAADLAIVLASTASVGRPWVNFEAGALWLRGIPVIPICHSGMRPIDLPVPLSMLQSILFSDPVGLRRLYDVLATLQEVDVPAVQFDALASELGAIETMQASSRQSVEVVSTPRILCAASTQYAQPQYKFDLDIAAVDGAFPGRLTVDRQLTSRRLLELLVEQQFDIVHLVLPVDRETGELIFSDVDPSTNLPCTDEPDTMLPSSFASLLLESRTRLVVLATCHALVLAVEVATVANMAASDTDVSGQQAADWAECFYGLLAKGRSVHRVFDLVRTQSRAPIRAIRQRDVAFTRAAPR
jgi:hypothetical protein